MTDQYEILELETPHGFLMMNGKQTAIAYNEPLPIIEPYLIVSGGEAFGIATLSEPVQMKEKEFHRDEWQSQHRVTPRERRQWWADTGVFYVYQLADWQPYEKSKLFENGQIIDEPVLTKEQWGIVSAAKELPKQITLLDNAVSVTEKSEFVIDSLVKCKDLDSILSATYQTDVVESKSFNEAIPIYSLALVRNPRMRVVKKSEKQEDDDMPYEIESRDGEFCIIKTEDGESVGCHETREEAEAQLTALRINVEAEEGESSVHTDKPRKRKPKKKKEMFGTEESVEQQLNFIRRQFEDQFNADSSLVAKNPESYTWIADIFESFVIADNEGRLFRVDYMLLEDEILFTPREQWVEVERGYRPKGFKLLGSGFKRIDNDAPEIAKKAGFMDSLRSLSKSIGDFLKSAETEEKEVSLFVNNVGIAQKEVNGELWHFTWSTNAFEDREKEMFSTNSLKRYVDQAKETDKGYFNLWHMKGTDFARKEWQMVIGRFLVEAGPYLDNKAGQSAKEFFKQYANGHSEIAPEGWGCSPEFRYLPEERATGTYENIWITRTSTLPKMAAANIWTETSQLTRSKMAITDYSEDQIKTAVEVFKDEEFVKTLIQEGENKTAELEAAGVAHKEKSEEVEPQQVNINMEELAIEVGKQFTASFDPITEAITAMATELKELKEWKAAQEKKAEVKAVTETPRYIFNLQRASENESTIVAEDDGLKNQRPNEAKSGSGDSWSQIFNK